MKIVIPDDYQNLVDRLDCYNLIRHHEITRYREPARDVDHLVERLADADVVVSIRERIEFSRALLQRLPKLKLIALVGRNSQAIDFKACTELGIPVSTGKSNSPVAPAELTVALILAARRNVALEAERMKRGDWPCTLSHRLRGSTLGIFGLGTIGQLVAEAGRGLGIDILVFGQSASAAKAQAAGYAVAHDKADLFERSDVLSLHVRLRPETTGIVTAEDLARMKSTALLVNTSRAELIAPNALLDALRKGRPGTRPSTSMSKSRSWVAIIRFCRCRTSYARPISAGRSGRISSSISAKPSSRSCCSNKARRCGLPIRMSFRAGDRGEAIHAYVGLSWCCR
jgi:D-3-phosphoglycerate dehydrogenase / 2-oxoglutarate reductase